MRTDMHAITKLSAGALLLASLVACGGGLSSTGTSSSGSSGGPTAIRLGNGNGSAFVSGTLALGSNSLSAGGSTSVTATLVDATGTLYTTPTDVTFNSPCVSSGLATIVGSGGGASATVTANSGTAIATYTAKGCSGTDTITATATVNNITLTATATVTVAVAALGSIQFVSASPTVITLKGMGGAGLQETSTVIFAVKDSVGGAVKGATVTFSLNTSVGGVALSTNSAISDANGDVQTIVQAGTFAGPVIVTASTVKSGTTISTQSSQLTINSGVPSQTHFSLSIDKFNVEGYDIDGNTAVITARVADRFGNPVPNGTPVSFIQAGNQFGAGGSVQGSCTTTNGTCNVTWTSQNPRPVTTPNVEHIGFAYILAFTQGEESFTDQNADGVFDKVSGVAEPFSDISEIFAPSAQFAGGGNSYVLGEPFYDFDQSGDHTSADGKWEGINCKAGTASCGTRKTTGVGSYACIVMSASGAAFADPAANGAAAPFVGGVVAAPGATTVSVAISDSNGNVLPKETTIKLDTSSLTGGSAALSPSSSGVYTVGNTTCSSSDTDWPARFTITITATTPPVSGSIGVLVTTPSGAVSQITITL